MISILALPTFIDMAMICAVGILMCILNLEKIQLLHQFLLELYECLSFEEKNGPPNFIRFPLFPGSLLVMEGATQEDWLHCLPRDTNCKEERVNLTFRTMYSLNKRSNRF